MQDPYSILGIQPGASKDEAKKAFKKRAMETHPDRGGNEEEFKKVNEAYEQIKNPQPRGPQGFPGGTWSFDGDINMTPGGFKFRRGGSVNDLFEEFFSFHGNTHQRVKETRIDLEVTLRDVIVGGDKDVHIRTKSGSHNVRVHIPRGINNGAEVRYENIGPGGSTLRVRFRIQDHPNWDRKGNNLIFIMDCDFWELVTGGRRQFAHLDGRTLTVNIPPMAEPGVNLRLGGQGIKSARQTGDLFVILKATMPKDIPKELMDSIKKHTGKY